ncbi:hypothetical protein [Sporosarcina sp. FSL K6-1508]|uniref:hypothetical protein n=1 Tax=Sporosarcina sp. FSL K6-1508 TaxID=2921553 RepID=UPI0030F4C856
MAKPFEFADFVDEFQVPFVYFNHQEGYWNDEGDYIEEKDEPIPMTGIVLPLTENDLKYAEAGTYSQKEKKLYTVDPLEEGRLIEYKGDKYTIQAFKDYTDYADVYIYLARFRDK